MYKGTQGRIVSSSMHSKRQILCVARKVQREDQREHKLRGDNEGHLIGDVMEMLKNISLCLTSFTPRLESYAGCTPPSKALTQNTRKVWVKKGTYA